MRGKQNTARGGAPVRSPAPASQRRAPGRPAALVVAALLALLSATVAPRTLAGQAAGAARLSGSVLDTAGAPIPTAGVELDLDGVWRAVSARGEFLLTGLAPGAHVLRVRALGFGALQQSFVVAAGDSASADVVLARVAQSLDTVRASAAAQRFGPLEFQERQRQGRGTYLTRESFESRAPSRLSDLLVTLPGVRRAPIESRLGTTEYVYIMRGVSTVNGRICPVNVYVDGRNYDLGPEDLDRLARPQEIEAIEVYAGASQIPPRFAGPTAYCGVIALWTRGAAN